VTDESWFAVKCVFRVPKPASVEAAFLYEERVILLLARDFDHAVKF
jgi:hypothetical protein